MAICDHYAHANTLDEGEIVREPLLTPSPHARLAETLPLSYYRVPTILKNLDAKVALQKKGRGDGLYHLGRLNDFGSNSPLPLFKRTVCLVSGILLLSLATISLFISGATFCYGSIQVAEGSLKGATAPIQRSWGAYSPYYSAEPYTPPPANCHITQVNIIQRHGARVPTSGASTVIIAAVKKLQGATDYTTEQLEFLSNYTYTLGTDGNLLPFGGVQSQESGNEAYNRYSRLISHENLPFIRASSGVRVVESATNWTAGFSLASDYVYNPPLSVILSESGNNTLEDNQCPNSGSSDNQTAIWAAIYGAPIAARLNTQAPGADLTADDIPRLMPLCAFESIANYALSPFCSLFTAEEFEQYEYFMDLGKYYGTGPGAYLGRVQGVGYVNELLARLTGQPVRDNTQTNRTLDAAPATFPLNRTLYADFSHDNQMVAIYAALGLFAQRAEDLDPAWPDPACTWVVSRLTPFSGRMVTERLTCAGRGVAGRRATVREETYVRILVNDALQPLPFCGGNRDGLCTLKAFVESQVYSREDGQGDFDKCFAV